MHLLAMGVILSFGAMSASAQQSIPWRTAVWADDFTTAPQGQYIISQDAAWHPDGYIAITPDVEGQAGKIYAPTPRDMRYFDVRFDAFFGSNESSNRSGADGIVAAFARTTTYPISYGGEMNFTGSGGYGMEFDTFDNSTENDPNGQHVALIYQQTSNHLRAELLEANKLENNAWHRIKITNANGVFRTEIDGEERLSHTVGNFATYNGYFGFTAASGNSYNPHRLDNVRIEVPTHTSIDFGRLSTCDTSAQERTVSIKNNLPDDGILEIADVSVTVLTGGDIFEPLYPTLPVTIANGDSLAIRIQIDNTQPGAHTSVLALRRPDGETLYDTLRVQNIIPSASWAPISVDFPLTYVGTTSRAVTHLVNTGSVPVTIRELVPSWNEFSVIQPATLPATIAPGDSLLIELQFAPRQKGPRNALLRIRNSCGDFFDAVLSGEATAERLRVDIGNPDLMLLPGGTGTVEVVLQDSPGEWEIFDAEIRIAFDPALLYYVAIEQDGSVLPASANVSASLQGNTIQVTIGSPEAWTGSGKLFGVLFRDRLGDFGCSPVTVDTTTFNPASQYPGIPFTSGGSGTVCINNSCRNPEGFLRIAAPTIQSYPNPATESINLRLDTPAETDVRIVLFDERGIEVRPVFDGTSTEGVSVYRITTTDLPSGRYYAVMYSGEIVKSIPVTIVR